MEHRQSAFPGDETSWLTWPAGSEYLRSLRQRGLVEGMESHGRFSRHVSTDSSICDDDKDGNEIKVLVGICAMSKKSHSSSMKEIIKRLENFTRLQILIFDEDVILDHPVEDWPVVNAFISFFSSGFPLDKAIAYKNLRQPFVVNDLEMQKILLDRTEVYRILEENNIPHPRYTVLNKEKDPNCSVVETDDSIEINGQLYVKPFVEKPIDAEDHNIYIYFPQSAGGGSTRLFRKVKDRSSVYSHTSNVRTNGAYLYEDFMPTDGTDVKIYTVGSDYQHAEARKSPCLDGKVERDANGKEVRYPILLSAREKVISRKVVWAFGQNVCGFDLLRGSGKCYVCDVNGFSFVKTSNKYYDDCARILGTLILRAVCPTLHIPYPLGPAPEDDPVVPTTSGQMMELRCVVALVRHGDRTPKQKLKMEVKNKLFFELFERQGGLKKGCLKLKHPSQLQEALDIVRQLLANNLATSDPDLMDKKNKLQQMKSVLEMYEFSGINRKLQLKYQARGHQASDEDSQFSMKDYCQTFHKERPKNTSLLLILKWGGELTPAGRIQAENLGKAFRTLYPGGQGQFEVSGLGFLRLHSTFRHDLKIYSSDEGRVQMTAAAFTKGLLALEGELTPIVVQMVKSSNTEGMLDGESKTCRAQLIVKERLQKLFNQDHDFTEEDYIKLNPTNTLALTNAMVFVKNPKAMCRQVYQMIKEITAKIRTLRAETNTRDLQLYHGETWELLIRRWAKLEKDFLLKNGDFQINKIPDIYDCIKYDLQHNEQTLQYERAQKFFMCSKALADLIIPQEYGVTVEEKLHIAQDYCSMFLYKIRSDFQQALISASAEESTTRLDSRYSKGVSSPGRFVRTRLYFSSESHIHSVMNVLRYGNFIDPYRPVADSQWERALNFLDATAEFNYMSHVVFMMYEDASKDEDSDERYHMELHFSPGAYTSCDEPKQTRGMGFRPKHLCDNAPEKPVQSSSSSSVKAAEKPAALLSRKSSQKSVLSENAPEAGFSNDPFTASDELGDYTTPTTTPTSPITATNSSPFTLPELFPVTDSEDHTPVHSKHSSAVDTSLFRTQGEGVRMMMGRRPLPYVDKSDKHDVSEPLIQRNYQTVQLPLHHQFHTRWSMSCISPPTSPSPSPPPDIMRGEKALYRYHTFPIETHRLINIKPFFNHQALEGVNRVPQLHPLETLHNTLTLHEIHDFLTHIVTVRFPSPKASNDNMPSHRPSPSAKKASTSCSAMATRVSHFHTFSWLVRNSKDIVDDQEPTQPQPEEGQVTETKADQPTTEDGQEAQPNPSVDKKSPNIIPPFVRACDDNSVEHISQQVLRHQLPCSGPSTESKKPNENSGQEVPAVSVNTGRFSVSEVSDGPVLSPQSVEEAPSGSQK